MMGEKLAKSESNETRIKQYMGRPVDEHGRVHIGDEIIERIGMCEYIKNDRQLRLAVYQHNKS